MTTQEDQDRLAARCDHKFVDSGACLKCGWTPPPAQNFVASLQQELANLRQIATEYDAEIGRLKARGDNAVASFNQIQAMWLEQDRELTRLRAENARLTAAIGGIYEGFISESLNGVVCSIPDEGVDAPVSRTYCARCRNRWRQLAGMATRSREEGKQL